MKNEIDSSKIILRFENTPRLFPSWVSFKQFSSQGMIQTNNKFYRRRDNTIPKI